MTVTHQTFDRKRRGKRDQMGLRLPMPSVPGAHGKGIEGVKETDIQAGIMRLLAFHPLVAWAHRLNVGAGRLANEDGTAGRFVRFAFPGCSDIIGQLKDGRFLAIEVKAAHGRLRDEQAHFLSTVNKFGGVAFVARKPEDIELHLKPCPFEQERKP